MPCEEVREGVSIGNAEIVLEVNNRTINVNMRSFLPTKRLLQPDNLHSGHRYEPVRVLSRTY